MSDADTGAWAARAHATLDQVLAGTPGAALAKVQGLAAHGDTDIVYQPIDDNRGELKRLPPRSAPSEPAHPPRQEP